MTIIELLVAAIILVLGALATFQLFDTATRTKSRAEQRQVGLDRAQREMEKLRRVSYDKLAMTAPYPAASTNPKNPGYRVHGTDYALNANGTGNAAMVVNGSALYGGGVVSGGTVSPGPDHFVSGDISGDVYRYVVWRDDPKCLIVCPGSQDLKRVVVAVKLSTTAASGERPYVETQSDFIDPTETALSDLPPGPSGSVTGQQFFLSDTRCAAVGSTSRAAITADHALHNTMGTCLSGAQTGTTPGAPDALLPVKPPGNTGDPTYDYASDAILEPSPNTDKGLQLLRQDSNGCSFTPGGTNPQAKVHRWVTDTMTPAFTLAGNATLELDTRTINDATMPGKICVYLFSRTAGVDTPLVDFGTGNAYFTWAPPGGDNWPNSSWYPMRLNMQFPSATIPVAQRLGVALSVERSATPTDGLQFLYDHPDHPARLEVDTTTPLGG